MTRPLSRRISAGALALLLSALAVAPHSHVGESFELFRPDFAGETLVHDITCAEPTALHWHADHAVEVETCLACLRNHFAGIPSIGMAPPISADASTLAAATSTENLLRVPEANFSRGPPRHLS